jgi:hypothetical protein
MALLSPKSAATIFLSHAEGANVVSRAQLHQLITNQGSLTAALLQRNQRPRQAGSGTIEEEPHAQCLRSLYGHQSHLPADMVDVAEQAQLRFVVVGIPLKARNPLLDRLPEAWADFKIFLRSAAGCHCGHLGSGNG